MRSTDEITRDVDVILAGTRLSNTPTQGNLPWKLRFRCSSGTLGRVQLKQRMYIDRINLPVICRAREAGTPGLGKQIDECTLVIHVSLVKTRYANVAQLEEQGGVSLGC